MSCQWRNLEEGDGEVWTTREGRGVNTGVPWVRSHCHQQESPALASLLLPVGSLCFRGCYPRYTGIHFPKPRPPTPQHASQQ